MSEYASGSKGAGGAPHVLDNPALASLTGPHAHFAERRGGCCATRSTCRRGWRCPTSPRRRLGRRRGAGRPRRGGAARRPHRRAPAGWEVTFDRGRAARRRRDRRRAGRRGGTARPRRRARDARPGRAHPARPLPAPHRRDWAPTSGSAGTARWSRWPASGCTRRAGPRSARSAPTRRSAARAWRPGWSSRSPTASGNVARRPSCTPRAATRTPSGSTSPSASGCAAPPRSWRRGCRRPTPGEERVGV